MNDWKQIIRNVLSLFFFKLNSAEMIPDKMSSLFLKIYSRYNILLVFLNVNVVSH